MSDEYFMKFVTWYLNLKILEEELVKIILEKNLHTIMWFNFKFWRDNVIWFR